MIDGPERCKQGMAGRETARALLPRARRLVLMRTEGCQERAWPKAESGGRGEEGERVCESERERACACVSVSVCLCVFKGLFFLFFFFFFFPPPFLFFFLRVSCSLCCVLFPGLYHLTLPHSFSLSLSSLAPQSCAYLATPIAALLSLVLVP